jgi:putative flavoprotein involved in K+ transport
MGDPKQNGKTAIGDRRQVVVVGGGQAGLAMSYCLKQHGIDHVVLEKHTVAHEWRQRRWDSFCLVTPNWQCRLPGHPYRGPEPTGFMAREAIVQYVLDYVRSFQPPLFEGVAVTGLRAHQAGGFLLETSAGPCHADQVVVATGGYHTPQIPRLSERISDDIVQIHSSAYRRPEALPPGDVLVVGSGQSGCQIAEDLHIAGRRVHLSVGSAPRTARRYRGRDVVEWLEQMGYYTLPVEEHPLKERVRAKANHYVTGRDGGRDIDLRQRALEGMRLYGRLLSAGPGRLTFGDDLTRNLDAADAVCESIKTTIDNFIAKENIDAPTEPRYVPVWKPSDEPDALDLIGQGVSSIIWSTGFRTDYRWIDVPVFNGSGYPVHHRGVTAAFGLYFIGLPWLHTWGSGRFSGVGTDATYLADQIQRRLQKTSPPSDAWPPNELALGS